MTTAQTNRVMPVTAEDLSTAETAAGRTGWSRLGEPFVHTLKPWQWSLVAVVSAAIAVVTGAQGHLTGDNASGLFTTGAWVVLAASLPVLSAVDLAVHMLPNRIIYPVAGIAGLLFVTDAAVGNLGWMTLIRATAIALGCLVFSLAVVLIAPVGGYGLGDVRLVTLVGFVLGTHSAWLVFAATILVPPLVALPIALSVLAVTRDPSRGVPFGPFIAAGTLLAVFAQPFVVSFGP